MANRAGLAALMVAMLIAPACHAAVGDKAAVSPGFRDYVLGRFAWSDDQWDKATAHFAQALARSPNDVMLLRRTFDLALASGNQELALQLVDRVAKSEQYDAPVVLLRVTDAVRRRDWKATDAARQDLAEAGYAAFVAPVIEAWTLFGRGKKEQALARLDPAAHEGFARTYVAEHRAHMLAAMKRYDEAGQAYETLLGGQSTQLSSLRLIAAAAMQAGKRPEVAERILKGGGSDPAVGTALERLAARQPIGAMIRDPRDGLAALFARMAADLSRERPLPIALTLARLSTFLAPERSEPWLVTGDILARAEQYDAALQALTHVREDDLLAPLARGRRAAILAETEREAESLRLLQQAVASPGATEEDWARLGDAHRAAERFREAADAYGRAIALVEKPAPEHWVLYFLRGSALEQAGDWKAAEPYLRQAVKLAPNDATALNYLGYSLLDRGLNLAEAQTLIERAAALKPDDGYIIDSLGWAHYRAGRYDKAVEALEKAIAEVPGDPTINDHLGDAYWKVGRRIEARFRWRAALDADPTEKQRAEIMAKLEYGLDAMPVQSAASQRQ